MKTRARKARDSARTKEVVDTVAQTDTVIEPPTSSCEESTVPEDGPVKNYEESAVEMDAPAKDSEEHDATDPSAIQDTAEAENIATEAPAEDSFSAVSVSTQEDSFIAVSVSTQEDSLRTVSVSTQESVIIISDDEDGDCTLGLGNSVLIIEEPHEKSLVAEKRPEELVLDEELAITFTRSGNVMPHARYDCMKYPFVRAEHDTNAPIEKNADVCDECYCYLCDKPAVQCPYWTTVSVCHCNAHNKSVFWKSQRDSALAGILTIFNLDLTEIDADLRHGGFLLLTFIHELSVEYNKYLLGKRVPRDQFYPCTCVCHRGRAMHSGGCNACITYHTDIVVYSYTDVYRKAEELIKKAESEKPKTAAVILLGLVKEVVYQTEPAMSPPLSDPFGSLRASTAMLLGRILSTIQKMLVLSGFPNALSEKFIRFFQSLPLPPHCYCFTNSLSVLPWDDLFLITVLLGQNVTGQRTKKGRKEFLYEVLPVIQARVQKLEEEENYKHLVRYLKAVRCNDTVQLQRLRAKIPFYMCKYGDFTEAAQSLVQLKCISCSVNIILTLDEFTLYLKMLRTESSPSGKHLVEQDEWASQKGVRMRKGVLIKLILRIIYSNKALLQSPKCWGALIKTWCSSPVLGPKGQLQPIEYDEPNIDFQRSVMDIAFPILDELKRHTYVNLPQPFMVMPDEAELILIVRALADKMLFDPIPPSSVLVVILAFGKNVWALRDLLEAITPRNDLVYQFTQKLADELCIQKPIVLHTWSTHGSSYLCELIYTFLTHLNMLVRSVGFHITDILIENFNMLPWARQIADFLQTKVLGTCIFFTPGERNELKKKIAACLAKV